MKIMRVFKTNLCMVYYLFVSICKYYLQIWSLIIHVQIIMDVVDIMLCYLGG
jgi:hypothetical protein